MKITLPDTCYTKQVIETCQQKHSGAKNSRKKHLLWHNIRYVSPTFDAKITATCWRLTIATSYTSKGAKNLFTWTQCLIHNSEWMTLYMPTERSLIVHGHEPPLHIYDCYIKTEQYEYVLGTVTPECYTECQDVSGDSNNTNTSYLLHNPA